MLQDTLGTRALEIAQQALTKIEQHEDTCAKANEYQRREYKNLREGIDRIEKQVNGLYSREWNTAKAVIALLLVCLGALVVKYIL